MGANFVDQVLESVAALMHISKNRSPFPWQEDSNPMSVSHSAMVTSSSLLNRPPNLPYLPTNRP